MLTANGWRQALHDVWAGVLFALVHIDETEDFVAFKYKATLLGQVRASARLALTI
jgi:hypothetical protein